MGFARPLLGRTVVVTRPHEQAASLAESLRRLGAEVLIVPTIRIEPRPLDDDVRAVLASLAAYDLAVFTSANGARVFLDYLGGQVGGHDAGALARARGGNQPGAAVAAAGAALDDIAVAAIGPATARALEERGVTCNVVAVDHVAEGLVETLDRQGFVTAGSRVLLATARRARPVLQEELRARGAHVDVLAIYDTVAVGGLAEPAARIERADFITFTSSSTVEEFAGLLAAGPGGTGRSLSERLAGVRICSIGPVTSRTLRGLGLSVAVEATEHTAAGLVTAIAGAARKLS